MLKFKPELYTDLRIDRTERIDISNLNIDFYDEKPTISEGVFIRVYNGIRWIYKSISSINEDTIQKELNRMYSKIHTFNQTKINQYCEVLPHKSCDFTDEHGKSYINYKKVSNFLSAKNNINGYDIFKVFTKYKRNVQFITSTGLYHKYNHAIYGFGVKITSKLTKKSLRLIKSSSSYNSLELKMDKSDEFINESIYFFERSTMIKPGKYKVILAPEVTGKFVHECFGHIYEYDYFHLLGYKHKGQYNEELNIIDDGSLKLDGYCPIDDEGILSNETYIIRDGKFNSFLYDIDTAIKNNHKPTGNARAVDFYYKPIIRMTNTYMKPSKLTVDNLFKITGNGIYVKSVNDACFDSTLVMEPEICYEICNGKIGEPIRVNKIYGKLIQFQNNILAIANDLDFTTSLYGGCYKDEQYPLMVAYGGPHILIDKVKLE